MFRFKIEYYFQTYHTGNLNISDTRTGIVIANNLNEAKGIIKKADDSFIQTACVEFEQIIERNDDIWR